MSKLLLNLWWIFAGIALITNIYFFKTHGTTFLIISISFCILAGLSYGFAPLFARKWRQKQPEA